MFHFFSSQVIYVHCIKIRKTQLNQKKRKLPSPTTQRETVSIVVLFLPFLHETAFSDLTMSHITLPPPPSTQNLSFSFGEFEGSVSGFPGGLLHVPVPVGEKFAGRCGGRLGGGSR